MTEITISGSVLVNFEAQVDGDSEPLPTHFHSTDFPALAAGGNGVTFFNTGLQLVAGRFIESFGLYSESPLTGIFKVGERNSAQDWDVKPTRDLAFSHPGGGWADFDLPALWAVPTSPPAGALFLGIYTASGAYERVSAPRTFKAGNVSGNGQSGFTVDTGAAPAIRYAYYNEMPKEVGGGAAVNWSIPTSGGLAAALVSVVAGCVMQPPAVLGNFEVAFIDVSRTAWGGDATLIIAPNGQAVLVDCGSPTMGAAVVEPYLRSRGITELHSVFITHQNVDHIGGVAELLERMPVGTLYLPDVPPDDFAAFETPMWANMVATATANGVGVVTVTAPDTPGGSPRVSLGDLDIYVMQKYEMTLRLEWPEAGVSALLLADAKEPQLDALIASNWTLAADVIKNPHHGAGDGNFYQKLADFPTQTHVANFPERMLAESASVRAEGQAIEAAGRDYFVGAAKGTIRAVFDANGNKQMHTSFTPYYFDLYHGHHIEQIYGSIHPGIYRPTWAY